jgi:hypothetical protein
MIKIDDNRLSLEQAIEVLNAAKKEMSRETSRMNEDCKILFEDIEKYLF